MIPFIDRAHHVHAPTSHTNNSSLYKTGDEIRIEEFPTLADVFRKRNELCSPSDEIVVRWSGAAIRIGD
jgi:hypothetical protein